MLRAKLIEKCEEYGEYNNSSSLWTGWGLLGGEGRTRARKFQEKLLLKGDNELLPWVLYKLKTMGGTNLRHGLAQVLCECFKLQSEVEDLLKRQRLERANQGMYGISVGLPVEEYTRAVITVVEKKLVTIDVKKVDNSSDSYYSL